MYQTFKVNRRLFILPLPRFFHSHIHTGLLIEIVSMIFAFAAYQQMLLFINHILPVVIRHFKIRNELDGIGWTSLLTQSAINASREINPEKLRISTPVLAFRGLEGNTVDRANGSTEVAGNTPFITSGIAGKHDPAAVPWRQIRQLLGIFLGFTLMKSMQEGVKYASDQA
jgi:hypothetical protein